MINSKLRWTFFFATRKTKRPMQFTRVISCIKWFFQGVPLANNKREIHKSTPSSSNTIVIDYINEVIEEVTLQKVCHLSGTTYECHGFSRAGVVKFVIDTNLTGKGVITNNVHLDYATLSPGMSVEIRNFELLTKCTKPHKQRN